MGNIYTRFYQNSVKTCFVVFDFLYHFYCNTLGTWISQFYYHRPDESTIEYPEYYKTVDLIEEKFRKFYSIQKIISTNYPNTVFPQAVLDFSNPENVDTKMETLGNLVDSLWIGKVSDEELTYFYCYSMLNNMNRKFAKIEEYMKDNGKKKSKVEFLFIEYTHPKMRHTIEFVVPKQFLLCYNELFSVGFVFYLLKKQTVTFEFDLDYKLNILDGQMRRTKLTANDYIVVHENDYKVNSIDK